MTKSFFGGVVVSQEVDAIARELIQEFQIPKLYNLAFMLNVDRCFDNHQALRLWLQHQADHGMFESNELLTFAKKKLIELANL